MYICIQHDMMNRRDNAEEDVSTLAPQKIDSNIAQGNTSFSLVRVSTNIEPVEELMKNLGPSIPFDEKQASVTSYPPGCPVLHVNARITPPLVTVAIVKSVSFSVISNELQYCIVPAHARGNDHMILASESQLQYAPRCPVEATVNDDSGPTTRQAFVLTSYQPYPDSVALYSLQDEGPSHSIFHGISKDLIKYRPSATSASATTNGAFTTTSYASASAMNSNDLVLWNNEPTERQIFTKKVSNDPQSFNPSVGGSIIIAPTKRPIESSHDETRDDIPDDIDAFSFKRQRSNEGAISALPPPIGPTCRELSSQRLPYSNTAIVAGQAHENIHASDSLKDFNDVHSKFIIPGCSFRLEAIQEFLKDNTDRLLREMSCRVHLKTSRDTSGRKTLNMHLELEGTEEDKYRAIIEIEQSLVATLHYEDKGVALYYMALLNDYRPKNMQTRVVYQHCPHLKRMKSSMKYIYVSRLPANYNDILGFLLGKSGVKKRRIMETTGCFLDFNLKCFHPHFCIYGDHEENVVKCIHEMEENLKEAQNLQKRGPPSHRRYE